MKAEKIIFNFFNKNRQAFVSPTFLCEELKLSVETVRKVLKELLNKGKIEKVRHGVYAYKLGVVSINPVVLARGYKKYDTMCEDSLDDVVGAEWVKAELNTIRNNRNTKNHSVWCSATADAKLSAAGRKYG